MIYVLNNNTCFSSVVIPKLFDDNPDIFRQTPQLIESRGFQSETHTVTTGDGYILRVFRIVNHSLRRSGRQPKPVPIILWHGVAVTSDSWLFSTNGRLDSETGLYREYQYRDNPIVNDCETNVTSTLAYTLSACGYDVWLPNTRGTHYSLGHQSMDSTTDPHYWQYTLTELGLYDIPAVVRYVMQATGADYITYIGHSLGTASMFVLLSLVPDFQQFIRPFIALAPIAYLGHIESIGRLGVPLEPLLKLFPAPLGIPVPIAQLIGVFVCGNQFLVDLCADIFYAVNGYDAQNFNRSIVPVDAAHSAATVSTWVYAHLAQLVVSKRFRMFDYGLTENGRRYGSSGGGGGQSLPPSYPLGNITSRNIALFRGLNDLLADNQDVQLLVQQLNVPLLDNYLVPDPKWNHQDFQVGTNQGYFVNNRILTILRQYD
ncbi:lysosomal acid lipase/cholesteryl ester hydrolase-like [Oppia nitens]|uniref:lysosomal acid lipase/cholesteryl ester hydrolase-like n=1 Tax=Oppia nitens TaxID=1686743 RepID=UPI0023DC1D58|nr:lysosomal acid lipase/cholesteryl ester hydrolase-like [Oppia nitens]